MSDYNSSNTVINIDDAVEAVLETIPKTGSHAATAQNKITTAEQVDDMTERKIWGGYITQRGNILRIRGVYNATNDQGNLIIK